MGEREDRRGPSDAIGLDAGGCQDLERSSAQAWSLGEFLLALKELG